MPPKRAASTRASSKKSSPRKKATSRKPAKASTDESVSEGDAYSESEPESLDSDALDEDDDENVGAKRKRVTKKKTQKKPSPRKRRKNSDEEEEEGEDIELKEGQKIVGSVVKAPTTGRVPAGQISQNTLDFLRNLKDPACNDREWFKLHEPVYRVAEQEWKDFVEEFTNNLTEVDEQIPPLPPKDLIHRIYRDVRFSPDKTPYKRGLSASFSRSGRKGIFAAFKPGGESLLAAGTWCPGKNELATMRSHILRSPARLRAIIADPEFVAEFGEGSIFGREDELKTAPKGVDKTHPDIDLLKCRSFSVVHYFTDQQVTSPEFRQELARVARVARPFVHCINDMKTLPPGGSSDDDE
ncbi:hypothetical protein PLICRDRAFT_668628 [Plicaturopsis crispa FD-325 SS-3]|nr:hypothetical protein PLICRDRAFT_668628 [Plicaturopsis crispa FD-325 SS-3]